ncbi:hypothetical protein Tco_1466241 [Tanacetum coccineum]
MAESSSHNPFSPEITLREEPVTLDKPKSPNPFLPADQIEFTFKEIAFTTNNEVALLYPSHPNSEYFKETLDDSKIWVSTPTGGIRGDIGYTREIGEKGTLKKSCLLPRWRLLMGQVDYARLIWEDTIHKLSKKTRENVVPYPSVHNWALTPNQTEGPPFTDHMKAICKKPGAKSGLKRKQSLEHTSESKTEASKSKTGQSEKETLSSLTKDKSLSHPSPPTLVVGEMHKEAHQAAGGPTSLGATNEEEVHPQLSSGHDASADSTAKVDPRLSAPNDRADEILKKIKLEDLLDLLKDTRSAFFTPDSPQDEPIIVSDKSEEEEEVAKDKDTHASSYDIPKDTSIPHPPSPKSAQIQALKAHV